MNHPKYESFTVGIITPMIYCGKVDLIETRLTAQRIEHITRIVLNHLTLYRLNILSTLIVGSISIDFLQHDVLK